MEKFGLTNQEIIAMRLKCLEPYIKTASVHNIEQDTIIKKAEVAWTYAVKPLLEKDDKETPDESQTPNQDSKP